MTCLGFMSILLRLYDYTLGALRYHMVTKRDSNPVTRGKNDY